MAGMCRDLWQEGLVDIFFKEGFHFSLVIDNKFLLDFTSMLTEAIAS